MVRRTSAGASTNMHLGCEFVMRIMGSAAERAANAMTMTRMTVSSSQTFDAMVQVCVGSSGESCTRWISQWMGGGRGGNYWQFFWGEGGREKRGERGKRSEGEEEREKEGEGRGKERGKERGNERKRRGLGGSISWQW